MKIKVWTNFGKQSVAIEDCLKVTAQNSMFYLTSSFHQSGEIGLDDFNLILQHKPQIVDEKAIELGKMREKLKLLFGIQS